MHMAMVAGLLRGISLYWVDMNRWHSLPVVGIPEQPFESAGAFERESEHVGMAAELEVASRPDIGVLTQKVLKEERVPGRAQMAFRSHHAARIKTRSKARGKRQGSHASPAKTRQVASAESVQYSEERLVKHDLSELC